jgi:hypothetical protein
MNNIVMENVKDKIDDYLWGLKVNVTNELYSKVDRKVESRVYFNVQVDVLSDMSGILLYHHMTNYKLKK